MTGSGVAYLDHAATTPMVPEATAAMLPYLGERFANPSGIYGAARATRRAVDDARDALAVLVGCEPGEVVFTSGGTEADNLAIFGAHAARPGRIVVSAIERDAVLGPATALGGLLAPVDADGCVDLDALQALLDDDVVLVSVMTVNNEVGVIQPIAEVVELVRRLAPRALVHTDAVQALADLDVAELTAGADLITVSGHKFGGPQGSGALVVRAPAASRLAPIWRGGGQEAERRPGTENVAAIVGLGAAAAALGLRRAGEVERIRWLRDRLADGLLEAIDGASETAPRHRRVAGNLHLHLPGAASEELLVLLDDAGVAASAGSACASGAMEPSHVLLAMGWSDQAAREAIRLTLGWSSEAWEIERSLEVIPKAVARLRGERQPGA